MPRGCLRFIVEAAQNDDVYRLYESFCVDPRVHFIQEPLRLQPELKRLTQQKTKSSKIWTDVYLAAFAIQANLELVSFFDTGSRNSPGLNCMIL
jgi:predicted nucleic acid-binding protein